ncbi:MAG: amidase [Candidatus Latescibacterota bacterium]|nr:amidase [Candidatus Latescibacterota bacterium]
MSDLAAKFSARLREIEQQEPALQALVPEEDRAGRLAGEARELTERSDSGEKMSLYGELVGIKDILHVEGLVTRAGTALPHTLFPADRDAACVDRLRQAGAAILGKTVTTEFAYFEPGPTTNPYNAAHTPGGSSSGSAAAVARGYCSVSLGTQTVGSVIRPAAFCGVIGFKPSYGRVPRGGLLLCSSAVDTIGVFAADVDTAVRGAMVIVDDWNRNSIRGDRPVLGVPDGPYLAQAAPSGRSAFEQQLSLLEEAGYSVQRIDMLEDIAEINARHSDVQAGEMAREHASWFDNHEALYRPRTREIILRGRQLSDEHLEACRAGRQILRDNLHRAMQNHGVHLLVCPSAVGIAPVGLERTGDPVMNLPWTHSGLPTVSLPSGWLDGLPLGLQVIAGFDQDESLLRWCFGLEHALIPLSRRVEVGA